MKEEEEAKLNRFFRLVDSAARSSELNNHQYIKALSAIILMRLDSLEPGTRPMYVHTILSVLHEQYPDLFSLSDKTDERYVQ
jgi:hypothetical protein